AQREMGEQIRIKTTKSSKGTGIHVGAGSGVGVGVGEGSGRRFTSQETRSFTVGASPRVTINTFDGKVTVRGWDKSEVSYTATKHANDEETLKQISIEAQQQGQTVSINAVEEEENGGV